MKAKIMVVDDTEGIRDLVGTFLEKAIWDSIEAKVAAAG